jgi:hypothetical protein
MEPLEGDQALLMIRLTHGLTRHREGVPYGFAAEKIQAVRPNVGEAFPFVPRDHRLLVVTNKWKGKSLDDRTHQPFDNDFGAGSNGKVRGALPM